MRAALGIPLALAIVALVLAQPARDADPHPRTVEEFRVAVQNVLSETGVPGAGIALVRTSGVEWAGGIGLADRENRIPVTADTHFRAGSIGKTFIAAAIVQMYLDDDLDLDTPVAELVSEIQIDNAWEITDPVRVIHLLQHTAGFDDMRFNEMYNLDDPPDMPLEAVLRRNPGSRIVRWRPGTRMSESTAGYTVAAHIIEKVTGEKYEDRIADRIFKPAGMPTSSFYLTKDDEALLARGYGGDGRPMPYVQMYHRPAAHLHTSARELGNFVHMLLNWGETEHHLVIDPEYLSNMEHPRSTLASQKGLRTGYGSGIDSFFVEGFPMLGHRGGIDGFSSWYAYSTSRDVGFVVLLNSHDSPAAVRRINQLAMRYLKADVEPPPKPVAEVSDATLRAYEGYYHDAAPASQAYAFLSWLVSGHAIRVDGNHLVSTSAFGGASTPLIPVSDTLFRLEEDPEPTRVFVPGDGDQMIMTGSRLYAERWPRWRIESARWAVLGASAIVLTPLIMVIPWIIQGLSRRRVGRSAQREGGSPKGGGRLKTFLVLCAVAFMLPTLGVWMSSPATLGTRNLWTAAMCLGTVLMPAAAILSFLFTLDAWRTGTGRWFRAYALAVSISGLIISGYLSAWGMIGFRSWTF